MLKLQLVKVSSQNFQKPNWEILDDIVIKLGDTDTFTTCRKHNTDSHIIFYLIINITYSQWIFCREPADCSIGYFAVSSFHTCAPDVMQRRQEQVMDDRES